MSLRTDIHVALDEVAPPAPHLEYQVRQAVKDLQHPAMAHVRPRLAPLRMPLSLVAAAVIVALMAGLVIAGRAWIQGNTPVTTPHVVINQADLKSLEARPLQLPALQPGATCPEGPTSSAAQYHGGPPLSYGGGPVYANRGLPAQDAWGTWVGIVYFIDPQNSGTILLRARDLGTGQAIVFADDPQNIGTYAEVSVPGTPAGKLVGTHYDPVWHQTLKVYSEVVMVEPKAPQSRPGWPASFATAGVPAGASGCIGFQLDGPDFTEVYVVDELI
ncbi:MAG TPA: hypothetical protein VEU76_00910 [Candidatus Udaeobacter sp.]|nr:hypothetical protein [Candidatus Udaeobacter sp.]